MDWIDTLDGWLEDAWRALWRRPSPKERRARARMAGVASLSLAVHMAVLLYFGSQLTDAYRLPEPPEEIVPPVEPVEAILIPPPPQTEPPPEPVLRRIEPEPRPQPQPVPVQPPAPVPPAPTPTPPVPRPAPPTPAPPMPAPMAPIQPNPAPPAPVNSAVRPLPSNLAPMARPVLPAHAPPEPTPPAAAPPAPRPAPPAPPKKKEDEDDKPIGRTAPPEAAPRQAAPNAAPLTVAPLPMAPVPRSATPPGAPSGGGANRPPGPGGANGDFRVRPSGVVEGGLRGALRGSTVGCDHRVGVALNRDERTACDERVGERGANAPAIAVGTELSRDKRGRMQTQTELNEAMRAYKGAPATGAGPASTSAPAPRVRDLVGGN